jgi:hypothetical protein
VFEGINSDEFTPKRQKKSSIENKRGDSRNEKRTIEQLYLKFFYYIFTEICSGMINEQI